MTGPAHCEHEHPCGQYNKNFYQDKGSPCICKKCIDDTRTSNPVQPEPGKKYFLIEEKVLDNISSYARGSWFEVVRSRPLESHDAEIREKIMDEFGILHGEAARKFNEYINDPNPVDTPEGRKITEEAMAIVQRERTALQDRDRLMREEGARTERERVLKELASWAETQYELTRELDTVLLKEKIESLRQQTPPEQPEDRQP